MDHLRSQFQFSDSSSDGSSKEPPPHTGRSLHPHVHHHGGLTVEDVESPQFRSKLTVDETDKQAIIRCVIFKVFFFFQK